MMPVSQFNNLQMQLVNKTGDRVTLTNLYVEVLLGGGIATVKLPASNTQTVTPGPPPGAGPPPEIILLPPACSTVQCPDGRLLAADSGGGTGCDMDTAFVLVPGGCPP
jgi:hypothetical protein